MNSNEDASVAVDDGWHTVVTKKRPTRTNTTTSVKSTKDVPKKKTAAPSRTNTNVSVRSVHVTIPNSVVEALAESNKAPSILSSCVDDTLLLDPVRVIDALHAPRPASHKSWKEMDPKERKKEKKTRMIAQAALAHRKANAHGKHRGYGQGNSFGASPAPAASWRDDKSGAEGGPEGEGEVMTIEGGLTAADFDGDEGDFSDYSDYSDDDSDMVLDEELADLAPDAPEDHDGDADVDALALATVAASKGAPRSILRTGTSGNLASVAFSADPIDRQAAAPARSSTAPSGKYLPPHRKVSIVAAMPDAPQPDATVAEPPAAPAPEADIEVEAEADESSVCASADHEDQALVAAAVSVTGSAAASVSASQKPERTATNTSTHRKGTPAVFLKNTKDRNMNDDWRTLRANATASAASVSRTNTNTSVTAASPSKPEPAADKADKEKPKAKGKAISRSNTNTSVASEKPAKAANNNKAADKSPSKPAPAAAKSAPTPTPAPVAAVAPVVAPVAQPQPKAKQQPKQQPAPVAAPAQLSQRNKKDKTKAQPATSTKKPQPASPVVSTDQLIRGLIGLFVLIVALRLLGLL